MLLSAKHAGLWQQLVVLLQRTGLQSGGRESKFSRACSSLNVLCSLLWLTVSWLSGLSWCNKAKTFFISLCRSRLRTCRSYMVCQQHILRAEEMQLGLCKRFQVVA